MPSSKGYQRDYAQEYATQKARGENGTGHNSDSAVRHRARRVALANHLITPGQEVDHKKPLSRGGGNALSNLHGVSPGTNHSFPRNADGSMKGPNPAARKKK